MPISPQPWQPVPIDTKLFLNIEEDELTEALAAVENAFITRAGTHSRFPGLKEIATLAGQGRVYLHDWRGDLIATTGDGYMFRINENLDVDNVTGVPISGNGRHVFAKTEYELAVAAGREIIQFAGEKTKILSKDAPLATHVQYIGGYVVANEAGSGRFFHAALDDTTSWNPIDVFAANSSPDPVISMLVTPFAELLVAGDLSIEQYEQLSSTSAAPFFRRWSVGEGLRFPYTMTFADNAVWFINKFYEFVRSSGQTSRPKSDDVHRYLQSLDDWTDAWIVPVHIVGHQFLLLQAPNATNRLTTKGVTLLFDFVLEKWSELYGWANGPARWPGWSYRELWGRHFVGGNGKLLELDPAVFTNLGEPQRILGRTAHLSEPVRVRVDNIRMKLRRGRGSNESSNRIRLRCNKDNMGFGKWISRPLGAAGNRHFFVEFGGFGSANSFQWEWMTTDDVDVAVMGLDRMVTPELR